MVLVALMCLTLPHGQRYGRTYGWSVRVAEQRVERGLKDHIPTSELLSLASPAIYPDPAIVRAYFGLLKDARIGAFAEYEENRVAAAPEPAGAVRR